MWYYAKNGEQRGPVTDADFQTLYQTGTINAETLVWREGMANWQPYGELFPSAGARTAPAPFAATPVAASWATEAQVRERDYEHEIGHYFGQSWDLFKSDAGRLLGVTALFGLCFLVVNGIPYLSSIAGLVFNGPLLGGLFLYYLKKVRGQNAAVGDAFSGFSDRFGQLLLGYLIPSLLAGLAIIPAVIMAVLVVVAGAVRQDAHTGDPLSNLAMSVPLLICGVLAVASICVMIYLQYCWMFTLWLVADKNMSFWPAMSLSRAVVRKHWWQTLLLGIVSGLVALAGLLLCGVGLLVAAPVAVAMWAYAYERLFGDLQPTAD